MSVYQSDDVDVLSERTGVNNTSHSTVPMWSLLIIAVGTRGFGRLCLMESHSIE